MMRYQKYIIAIIVVFTFCFSICFIPINATHFIPIVEKQAEQDYGVQVRIEKLIFRFGPTLKIKAPKMHVMYEDGQKFAQFDNVKFYVPWSTIVKDSIYIKKIYADKVILKVNSNDKYFLDVINRFKDKDYKSYPNLKIRNYNISYKDSIKDKQYTFKGDNFELTKLLNYKNVKLISNGNLLINDKSYISYDITLLPNFNLEENKDFDLNLIELAEQIENLDFHSDILADLKISKNSDNDTQISGLVNVDNISVLDPDRKNPKSFVYLTFFGRKTGVLSNIYASSDKKIYAEGIVNNSKKPEFDIKVKTDNIRIADVYKKIKVIIDCSKYKKIESIDGNLIADFNIKGDLSKIKSTGYLKISDASIKANGLNIDNINSDIDFSNNSVLITNAIGYVNNAPIMLKGKINKNVDMQLLMNKVELKELISSDYGIKKGIISLDALLTGTLDNIVHKENIQIEKFEAVKNNNIFSFDKLNINTSKENTAYISNIQVKPSITEIIKIPSLKLVISDDNIKIPETNIYMPNSKMQLKADILNYNNNNFIFNLILNGFINSKDLSGITTASSIYPIKVNINGNKETQNVDAQLQVLKASVLDEPSVVNLAAKLENNLVKIEDLSVLSFSGNLSNNFKSNLKGTKKIIVNGIIENFDNPVFKNFRIYIPQQLNVNFKDTIAQLKGDVFINGKFPQPEIVGQVTVTNLINQFMQMALNNLTLDFNKNVVAVNVPILKISDSSAGLNAVLLTDFSKAITVKSINIKSKYFNADTLLMYKDNPLVTAYPIVVQEGKLYAERAGASLYGSPIYMSALNCEYKLADNILDLGNLSSEIYNGKLAGAVKFNLKDDSFSSKVQAREVSASPIFDIVLSKKDSVSGTMDFDLLLKGNLQTIQTLNGDIKFMVHNGHMGTLGKLEHLLYAQNVVADNMLRTSLGVVTKAITLKDTGLFKYLCGDIKMKGGIAYINMLQSQGPLMTLFVKGQYNPTTDYAKLTVLGRLSDEITGCLGAFGEFSLNKLMIMLTGEENHQNVTVEDIDKLPQLPVRNTKEFRTIINGILEKPSSVIQFNWISYTKKSLRQKDVVDTNEKVPDFIEALPY